MKFNKKFQVYSTITKSAIPKEDETPLILEGIASTTGVDLEGDFMTTECIESMKQQALGCNIHADHMYGLGDVVGTVTEVLETDDNTLKILFNILPSYQEKLLEFLDNGVNLGLSIGGSVTDYTELEDGWKINDLELYEISLTPMPANMDTFGSVAIADGVVKSKCLNGACKKILGDIMTQKENLETKEAIETLSTGIAEAMKSITSEITDMRKEFNEMLTKEPTPEGAEPVSKEEVTNMINEALVSLKDTIVAEVLEEVNNQTKAVEPPIDEEDEKKEEEEEEEEEKAQKSLSFEELKEQVLNEVLESVQKQREPTPTDVSKTKGETVEKKANVMSRRDAAKALAGRL